ncbi:phage late control D family protein [Pseudomonas sp. B21-040]|jgi:phage protein D|uniref:phage late control D family protein n=1 Tax=unclassified Pseudomonas TaxID=196821 RepID=UPI001CBF38F8|nr:MULTISPECIES: phage late control D family protein [unclassified Pseudomonas]UVL41578.1 phage late control D family protein [Pseudomonas sp. B21-040]
MTLGFTPAVEIYGANATLLNERLIQWEHIDSSGIESDQIKLLIDVEGLEGLPSLGGRIGLLVGYKESGLVDKGVFVITQRSPVLYPLQVSLIAMSAPFSEADETGFKQRRSASYGPITLGALFRELTMKHGFSPRVAPELESKRIDHIDQSNETDMGFLTRVASIYGAITKPVNGLYVLAKGGQLKSISGKTLTEVVLSVTTDNRPGDRSFTSAVINEKSQSKYKGCIATWWDATAGIERKVKLGLSPFRILRLRSQNHDQALAVAEGELRRLERAAFNLKINCPGHPELSAEGVIRLDASWPRIMQGRWAVTKLTASGSREKSYQCVVDANCLDPTQ